ncbi:hypothetical protein pb186bvf_002579 [Paramecium bursaria]
MNVLIKQKAYQDTFQYFIHSKLLFLRASFKDIPKIILDLQFMNQLHYDIAWRYSLMILIFIKMFYRQEYNSQKQMYSLIFILIFFHQS